MQEPEGSVFGQIDMARYLSDYGIAVKKVKPTVNGAGTMYMLERCLFNPGHKHVFIVVQRRSGQVSYNCFHRDCMTSKTWHDARRAISGHAPILQYCLPTARCVFSLSDYIKEQITWSEATFGSGVRTEGIIKHIEKELLEIRREPHKLLEWVDVIILALDGAWRAGFTPQEIITGLELKQAVNKVRRRPAPGPDNEQIEHIREEEQST